MHDEPPSPLFDANPLIKEVPGHLFTFEEKLFGMSLQQFLTDLSVVTGSFSFTGSLPLVLRLLVCTLITLLAMVLVHGKKQGIALSFWLYLHLRFQWLPRHTIWHPREQENDRPRNTGEKRVPSIQETWVPLETLQQGIAGKNNSGQVRYWMVLEMEGKNIHLLPEQDQRRTFRRFEGFLTGLEFHLQLLSSTEQIDPHTAPPLRAQQEALATLTAVPHLQALQQASLETQKRQMTTCTRTRHFLVVSASSTEPVFQRPEGNPHTVLSSLKLLLPFYKKPAIPSQRVRDQLRIRTSVVRKAMQQADLHIWPLDDREMVHLLTQCLAPGSTTPSFLPELVEARSNPVRDRYPRLGDRHKKPPRPSSQSRHQHHTRAVSSAQGQQNTGHTNLSLQPFYQKRLRGMHGFFSYQSPHPQIRFEPDLLEMADLIAPSRIAIAPDVVQIQVGDQTRFIRTFTVTSYGHHLLCGWVNTLHDLGVPLLTSIHLEPVDSRLMLLKLEQAQTRLESKRLSDQKTLRITRADQIVEIEQIRGVARALASKQVKIFEVSLTISVHAGSLERVEQRSRYLLSHLRDMQIQARPAILQQDLAWQSGLPVGLDLLQNWIKLPSGVASTLLPATSGTVGTPTGIFLGYTGNGLSRRPVYLNPWSAEKKIANPHICVIGETGQGKSWIGKTIATGLMGLGLADVCVLDKDDDYLSLHEALPGESQRYTLARSCPINLFDIPFGPGDVDPQDPGDLLADFFDNSLLTGLSLLVTDEGTSLSKSEEAYLMHVARAVYADHGLTSEAIRLHPETLLLPAPTLADFITTMGTMPALSETMRQSLLERLGKAAYLFQGGPTRISLEKPLTIFSIRGLDQKWFALMTFVVHNVLMRHRALRQDERYLAYIVEEASYLFKHAAGRRYLENGSRGFRKVGIAQITISQHPRDFLEAGQVVLSNAGTVFYLGMQRTTVEKLQLPEELERILIDSIPGQCVLRIGNEYAPLSVWSHPAARTLFTTDPAERRAQRMHTQHPPLPVKNRHRTERHTQ